MDLLQPIVCADSNHVRETMNHNNDETTMGRVFVKPTVHDVLCGRGKDCFRHEGNIRFRALIDTMLSQYTMSNSKKHKMQIIQLVVQNIIEGGGRFLKKENRNKLWYDGGVLCGKDKVGHSFRDAKGQGRRKSSKGLQDLNDKVASSHDAEVATLSEENRGAVALTVFKMGFTNSLNNKNAMTATLQPGTLLGATTLSNSGHPEYSAGKSQLDATEKVIHFKSSDIDLFTSTASNVTNRVDEHTVGVFNKRVGYTVFPATVNKEIDGFACHVKNTNDPNVDPAVPEDADEDVNAASSLLFLQRAFGTRRTETGVPSETNNSAVLPTNDTTHTANPFLHSWAVAVPSESVGTKSYYFI